MVYRPLAHVGWNAQESKSHVAFLHRSQWIDYDASFGDPGNAPTTDYFSILSQVSLKIVNVIGMTVVQDQLGALSSTSYSLFFGSSVTTSRGDVALGIQPVFSNIRLNSGLLRAIHNEDDLVPTAGKVNEFNFDFNLGVSYKSKKVNVGFGVQDFLEPDYNFGLEKTQNDVSRNYLFNLGFWRTVGYKRKLLTSMVFMSDDVAWSGLIQSNIYFDDNKWVGLGYRHQEGVLFNAGSKFLKDDLLHLGVAFDLIIFDSKSKELLSTEIFIRYNLPSLVIGGRKAVKTPRFSN